MKQSTTIVLGWDGLDYDLVQHFDMAAAFGPSNTRLETFDNPVIGKPHTYEVWPSIITGVHPDDHGLHADRYTHGQSWSNPLLNVAALVSKYTVPDALRWRVGRMLRGRGASFEFESLDYYRENGIWTVFDGRQAFALGIPNARSEHDEALDIEVDRGATLAEYMAIETDGDGQTVHVPSVSLSALSTRLEADLGRKLGAVRAALRSDYDLVFVWLGYLDTVGHVAPTVADPEAWVREGYETAAQWTWFIRDWLKADDEVICVSDHGLKDGGHTSDAFFGWWRPEPVLMPESVLDVAETIHHLAPRSTHRDEPHEPSEATEDFEAVNERLDALGYT